MSQFILLFNGTGIIARNISPGKLGMRPEPLPGLVRERRLSIEWFPQRFSAPGLARPLQPAPLERSLYQIQCVRRNCCLFLLPDRLSAADVKSGEQQRDPYYGAPRICRQRAGSL